MNAMRISQLAEASGVPATALRFYESTGLLPAERFLALAALTAAEQHCCPFFDFRLHLDGPVVHLEARAPAGAAHLLDQLFAPKS